MSWASRTTSRRQRSSSPRTNRRSCWAPGCSSTADRREAGEVGTPGDSAPEPIARPNRFDVDLGAIAHNVMALRAVIPDGTRICAAVKADAYGFGLLPVARTLTGAGVDLLGLVDLRDAVALRQDGIVCPILLYDGNLPDERLMRQV